MSEQAEVQVAPPLGPSDLAPSGEAGAPPSTCSGVNVPAAPAPAQAPAESKPAEEQAPAESAPAPAEEQAPAPAEPAKAEEPAPAPAEEPKAEEAKVDQPEAAAPAPAEEAPKQEAPAAEAAPAPAPEAAAEAPAAEPAPAEAPKQEAQPEAAPEAAEAPKEEAQPEAAQAPAAPEEGVPVPVPVLESANAPTASEAAPEPAAESAPAAQEAAPASEGAPVVQGISEGQPIAAGVAPAAPEGEAKPAEEPAQVQQQPESQAAAPEPAAEGAPAPAQEEAKPAEQAEAPAPEAAPEAPAEPRGTTPPAEPPVAPELAKTEEAAPAPPEPQPEAAAAPAPAEPASAPAEPQEAAAAPVEATAPEYEYYGTRHGVDVTTPTSSDGGAGGGGGVSGGDEGVDWESNTSQQRESIEEGYVDEQGNLIISKKVTRIVTTTKTVYGDSGEPKIETSETVQTTESVDKEPPVSQEAELPSVSAKEEKGPSYRSLADDERREAERRAPFESYHREVEFEQHRPPAPPSAAFPTLSPQPHLAYDVSGLAEQEQEISPVEEYPLSGEVTLVSVGVSPTEEQPHLHKEAYGGGVGRVDSGERVFYEEEVVTTLPRDLAEQMQQHEEHEQQAGMSVRDRISMFERIAQSSPSPPRRQISPTETKTEHAAAFDELAQRFEPSAIPEVVKPHREQTVTRETTETVTVVRSTRAGEQELKWEPETGALEGRPPSERAAVSPPREFEGATEAGVRSYVAERRRSVSPEAERPSWTDRHLAEEHRVDEDLRHRLDLEHEERAQHELLPEPVESGVQEVTTETVARKESPTEVVEERHVSTVRAVRGYREKTETVVIRRSARTPRSSAEASVSSREGSPTETKVEEERHEHISIEGTPIREVTTTTTTTEDEGFVKERPTSVSDQFQYELLRSEEEHREHERQMRRVESDLEHAESPQTPKHLQLLQEHEDDMAAVRTSPIREASFEAEEILGGAEPEDTSVFGSTPTTYRHEEELGERPYSPTEVEIIAEEIHRPHGEESIEIESLHREPDLHEMPSLPHSEEIYDFKEIRDDDVHVPEAHIPGEKLYEEGPVTPAVSRDEEEEPEARRVSEDMERHELEEKVREMWEHEQLASKEHVEATALEQEPELDETWQPEHEHEISYRRPSEPGAISPTVDTTQFISTTTTDEEYERRHHIEEEYGYQPLRPEEDEEEREPSPVHEVHLERMVLEREPHGLDEEALILAPVPGHEYEAEAEVEREPELRHIPEPEEEYEPEPIEEVRHAVDPFVAMFTTFAAAKEMLDEHHHPPGGIIVQETTDEEEVVSSYPLQVTHDGLDDSYVPPEAHYEPEEVVTEHGVEYAHEPPVHEEPLEHPFEAITVVPLHLEHDVLYDVSLPEIPPYDVEEHKRKSIAEPLAALWGTITSAVSRKEEAVHVPSAEVAFEDVEPQSLHLERDSLDEAFQPPHPVHATFEEPTLEDEYREHLEEPQEPTAVYEETYERTIITTTSEGGYDQEIVERVIEQVTFEEEPIHRSSISVEHDQLDESYVPPTPHEERELEEIQHISEKHFEEVREPSPLAEHHPEIYEEEREHEIRTLELEHHMLDEHFRRVSDTEAGTLGEDLDLKPPEAADASIITLKSFEPETADIHALHHERDMLDEQYSPETPTEHREIHEEAEVSHYREPSPVPEERHIHEPPEMYEIERPEAEYSPAEETVTRTYEEALLDRHVITERDLEHDEHTEHVPLHAHEEEAEPEVHTLHVEHYTLDETYEPPSVPEPEREHFETYEFEEEQRHEELMAPPSPVHEISPIETREIEVEPVSMHYERDMLHEVPYEEHPHERPVDPFLALWAVAAQGKEHVEHERPEVEEIHGAHAEPIGYEHEPYESPVHEPESHERMPIHEEAYMAEETPTREVEIEHVYEEEEVHRPSEPEHEIHAYMPEVEATSLHYEHEPLDESYQHEERHVEEAPSPERAEYHREYERVEHERYEERLEHHVPAESPEEAETPFEEEVHRFEEPIEVPHVHSLHHEYDMLDEEYPVDYLHEQVPYIPLEGHEHRPETIGAEHEAPAIHVYEEEGPEDRREEEYFEHHVEVPSPEEEYHPRRERHVEHEFYEEREEHHVPETPEAETPFEEHEIRHFEEPVEVPHIHSLHHEYDMLDEEYPVDYLHEQVPYVPLGDHEHRTYEEEEYVHREAPERIEEERFSPEEREEISHIAERHVEEEEHIHAHAPEAYEGAEPGSLRYEHDKLDEEYPIEEHYPAEHYEPEEYKEEVEVPSIHIHETHEAVIPDVTREFEESYERHTEIREEHYPEEPEYEHRIPSDEFEEEHKLRHYEEPFEIMPTEAHSLHHEHDFLDESYPVDQYHEHVPYSPIAEHEERRLETYEEEFVHREEAAIPVAYQEEVHVPHHVEAEPEEPSPIEEEHEIRHIHEEAPYEEYEIHVQSLHHEYDQLDESHPVDLSHERVPYVPFGEYETRPVETYDEEEFVHHEPPEHKTETYIFDEAEVPHTEARYEEEHEAYPPHEASALHYDHGDLTDMPPTTLPHEETEEYVGAPSVDAIEKRIVDPFLALWAVFAHGQAQHEQEQTTVTEIHEVRETPEHVEERREYHVETHAPVPEDLHPEDIHHVHRESPEESPEEAYHEKVHMEPPHVPDETFAPGVYRDEAELEERRVGYEEGRDIGRVEEHEFYPEVVIHELHYEREPLDESYLPPSHEYYPEHVEPEAEVPHYEEERHTVYVEEAEIPAHRDFEEEEHVHAPVHVEPPSPPASPHAEAGALHYDHGELDESYEHVAEERREFEADVTPTTPVHEHYLHEEARLKEPEHEPEPVHHVHEPEAEPEIYREEEHYDIEHVHVADIEPQSLHYEKEPLDEAYEPDEELVPTEAALHEMEEQRRHWEEEQQAAKIHELEEEAAMHEREVRHEVYMEEHLEPSRLHYDDAGLHPHEHVEPEPEPEYRPESPMAEHFERHEHEAVPEPEYRTPEKPEPEHETMYMTDQAAVPVVYAEEPEGRPESPEHEEHFEHAELESQERPTVDPFVALHAALAKSKEILDEHEHEIPPSPHEKPESEPGEPDHALEQLQKLSGHVEPSYEVQEAEISPETEAERHHIHEYEARFSPEPEARHEHHHHEHFEAEVPHEHEREATEVEGHTEIYMLDKAAIPTMHELEEGHVPAHEAEEEPESPDSAYWKGISTAVGDVECFSLHYLTDMLDETYQSPETEHAPGEPAFYPAAHEDHGRRDIFESEASATIFMHDEAAIPTVYPAEGESPYEERREYDSEQPIHDVTAEHFIEPESKALHYEHDMLDESFPVASMEHEERHHPEMESHTEIYIVDTAAVPTVHEIEQEHHVAPEPHEPRAYEYEEEEEILRPHPTEETIPSVHITRPSTDEQRFEGSYYEERTEHEPRDVHYEEEEDHAKVVEVLGPSPEKEYESEPEEYEYEVHEIGRLHYDHGDLDETYQPAHTEGPERHVAAAVDPFVALWATFQKGVDTTAEEIKETEAHAHHEERYEHEAAHYPEEAVPHHSEESDEDVAQVLTRVQLLAGHSPEQEEGGIGYEHEEEYRARPDHPLEIPSIIETRVESLPRSPDSAEETEAAMREQYHTEAYHHEHETPESPETEPFHHREHEHEPEPFLVTDHGADHFGEPDIHKLSMDEHGLTDEHIEEYHHEVPRPDHLELEGLRDDRPHDVTTPTSEEELPIAALAAAATAPEKQYHFTEEEKPLTEQHEEYIKEIAASAIIEAQQSFLHRHEPETHEEPEEPLHEDAEKTATDIMTTSYYHGISEAVGGAFAEEEPDTAIGHHRHELEEEMRHREEAASPQEEEPGVPPIIAYLDKQHQGETLEEVDEEGSLHTSVTSEEGQLRWERKAESEGAASGSSQVVGAYGYVPADIETGHGAQSPREHPEITSQYASDIAESITRDVQIREMPPSPTDKYHEHVTETDRHTPPSTPRSVEEMAADMAFSAAAAAAGVASKLTASQEHLEEAEVPHEHETDFTHHHAPETWQMAEHTITYEHGGVEDREEEDERSEIELSQKSEALVEEVLDETLRTAADISPPELSPDHHEAPHPEHETERPFEAQHAVVDSSSSPYWETTVQHMKISLEEPGVLPPDTRLAVEHPEMSSDDEHLSHSPEGSHHHHPMTSSDEGQFGGLRREGDSSDQYFSAPEKRTSSDYDTALTSEEQYQTATEVPSSTSQDFTTPPSGLSDLSGAEMSRHEESETETITAGSGHMSEVEPSPRHQMGYSKLREDSLDRDEHLEIHAPHTPSKEPSDQHSVHEESSAYQYDASIASSASTVVAMPPYATTFKQSLTESPVQSDRSFTARAEEEEKDDALLHEERPPGSEAGDELLEEIAEASESAKDITSPSPDMEQMSWSLQDVPEVPELKVEESAGFEKGDEEEEDLEIESEIREVPFGTQTQSGLGVREPVQRPWSPVPPRSESEEAFQHVEPQERTSRSPPEHADETPLPTTVEITATIPEHVPGSPRDRGDQIASLGSSIALTSSTDTDMLERHVHEPEITMYTSYETEKPEYEPEHHHLPGFPQIAILRRIEDNLIETYIPPSGFERQASIESVSSVSLKSGEISEKIKSSESLASIKSSESAQQAQAKQGKRYSTSRRSSAGSRRSSHDESPIFSERITPELQVTWSPKEETKSLPGDVDASSTKGRLEETKTSPETSEASPPQEERTQSPISLRLEPSDQLLDFPQAHLYFSESAPTEGHVESAYEAQYQSDVQESEPTVELELETVPEEAEDDGPGSAAASDDLQKILSAVSGGFPPTSSTLLSGSKRSSRHGSSDNVSEASLVEFERLERELALRGDTSLSSSEVELFLAAQRRRVSDNGSQNSLAEFERLEKDFDAGDGSGSGGKGSPEQQQQQQQQHVAIPATTTTQLTAGAATTTGTQAAQQDVMILSDIREESEPEDMSTRDDDEEDATADIQYDLDSILAQQHEHGQRAGADVMFRQPFRPEPVTPTDGATPDDEKQIDFGRAKGPDVAHAEHEQREHATPTAPPLHHELGEHHGHHKQDDTDSLEDYEIVDKAELSGEHSEEQTPRREVRLGAVVSPSSSEDSLQQRVQGHAGGRDSEHVGEEERDASAAVAQVFVTSTDSLEMHHEHGPTSAQMVTSRDSLDRELDTGHEARSADLSPKLDIHHKLRRDESDDKDSLQGYELVEKAHDSTGLAAGERSDAGVMERSTVEIVMESQAGAATSDSLEDIPKASGKDRLPDAGKEQRPTFLLSQAHKFTTDYDSGGEKDSVLASSFYSGTDEMETAPSSQETHGLLSGDTVGTYQEYEYAQGGADEGDRDSLTGDLDEILHRNVFAPEPQTPVAESPGQLDPQANDKRADIAAFHETLSPTMPSSSSGQTRRHQSEEVAEDIPYTFTTYETSQEHGDGSVEIITRTVSTRVIDPVTDAVRFTGPGAQEKLAEYLRQLEEQNEHYEEFESIDEMGNVTKTVVRRVRLPSTPSPEAAAVVAPPHAAAEEAEAGSDGDEEGDHSTGRSAPTKISPARTVHFSAHMPSAAIAPLTHSDTGASLSSQEDSAVSATTGTASSSTSLHHVTAAFASSSEDTSPDAYHHQRRHPSHHHSHEQQQQQSHFEHEQEQQRSVSSTHLPSSPGTRDLDPPLQGVKEPRITSDPSSPSTYYAYSHSYHHHHPTSSASPPFAHSPFEQSATAYDDGRGKIQSPTTATIPEGSFSGAETLGTDEVRHRSRHDEPEETDKEAEEDKERLSTA